MAPLVGPAPPDPLPVPMTPEEAARLAWPWLRVNCAQSTWDRFVASIAVREPQVKAWTS
jgi:hypothetical protein